MVTEKVFEAPLSGASLLKFMRDHKVKLNDVTLSVRHVQYYEDWEESFVIVSFSDPKGGVSPK